MALDIPQSGSSSSTSSYFVFSSTCSVIVAVVAALGTHALVQHRSPDQCRHALDFWFSTACFQVLGFVVAFRIGSGAENGSSWWFVEPRSRVAKAAFACTWAMLLPLLSVWTAVGIKWLSETMESTPDCFPENGYFSPLLCAIFQVFCILGCITYTVFVANVWDAERCRRVNAAAIRSVEDSDLVHRWGRLKPAAHMELCGGLSPKELESLPRHTVDSDGGDCVICLSGLQEGDNARSLPECGHVFHRACIDLWLLRQTRCPLCAGHVCIAKGAL